MKDWLGAGWKRIYRRETIFVLIALAYAVYALRFIFETSFVVDGERYFALFDDMMISMRYARNLAQGYGLVWNAGGERVEGFTNLLWTLYMAAIHFLPLAASKISVVIQLTGAACILATLFVAKRIAELLSPALLVSAGAMVLTAFYLPLNNWALLGTEVSLLTLLYTGALYLALKNIRAQTASALPFVLLGVGTLVRIDMVATYVGILALLVVLDRSHWRTHLGWGIGLLALFAIPQTLFRWFYYGDVLPNTYYLKMTGFPELLRVQHGIFVGAEFVLGAALLFLLGLSAFCWRRDRMMLVLGGAVCIPIAYSMYVGGDAWEFFGGSNRYISIGMPSLFVLAMFGLSKLVERSRASSREVVRWGGVAAAVAVFAALLLGLNRTDTSNPWSLWLTLEPAYGVDQNPSQVRLALDVARVTKSDAQVAVVLAGTLPYFTDRYMIDLLGKSDKRIAREPMHLKKNATLRHIFYPGHLKWDYAYSVDELKPDVVLRLWRVSKKKTVELLTPAYKPTRLSEQIFLRADSNKVLWDQLGAGQP